MGCGCQKREPARFVPYPAAMPTMRGPVPPPPVGLPPPNPLAVCMANRQSNVVAGENVDVARTVNRCSGQNTYVVSTEVDKKWIESELAKKADKTTVASELARKANKTYVDSELARKADKTYVDSELARKANKTYVDSELARKADKTYVDSELDKKADKSYVSTELAKKADRTYVDDELSNKVDKVDGKGLSSNDYTDEDKEKLTSLEILPSEEFGTTASLVSTGDKYTWDEKQDRIDYYLTTAQITGDGALVIMDQSGNIVTFTGNENAAIDHIATDDGDLPIVGKRVTIPMAEPSAAGVVSVAGLVRGVYENF